MTTKLPPALQAWHAWLEWFDPDIAAMLGDLLLRLDPLLGRSGARAQQGMVEPDGIDDLRQRGPYERLLLSEWALADAVPDEFLRRAANNEHLFLAPRLVTRQADALITAVFDAGPAQWGAARLVHAAMWILLARRAQVARARFAWGLAHEPGVLHDADSPAMLKRLLQARTHEIAEPARWRAWQDFFAASGSRADERWQLAAGPTAADGFSHAAWVRRGFDDRLHVSVGTKQARRRAALELPSARQAGWLLRGDFLTTADEAAHRKAKGKLSLRQPPLISVSGQYVALPLLGESRAAVFKIQPAGQRKQAAPRYSSWSSGSELLGAALSEKNFGGMMADAHYLYFWKMPGFHTVPRPQSGEFAITPGLARWPPCVWLNNGGRTHRLIMLDNAGHLVSWTNASTTPGRQAPTYAVVGEDVIALAQADSQRAIYAQHDSGYVLVKLMHREGQITLVTQLPASSRPASVLFGGRFSRGEWTGAVCIEQRTGARGGKHCSVCRLYEGRPQDGFKEHELVVAADWKLLGLVVDMQSPSGHLLLALRADRRTLVGIGQNGTETVYQSASDIMSAAVSMDGERVALVNLDGQLVVLGEGGRRLLMCVSGGADG